MSGRTDIAEFQAMTMKLVNLHQSNRSAVNEQSAEVLNAHRDAALRAFESLGIPDQDNENYRYSDMMTAFGQRYGYSFKAPAPTVDPQTIFHCAVPDLDTHTVIVENGWFYKQSLEKAQLPKEIVVRSLADAAIEFPELFEKHYNTFPTDNKEAITHLNTAFAKDGFFIYIPDGVVIDKPIQIINLLRGQHNLMVNQRNLIVAGKNSQAKIIVCDHTLSNKSFFPNIVTEVAVDENAIFDLYSIQNQHNHSAQVTSTYINQKKNSNTLTNTLTLHGGFVRNNVFVHLGEEHAEASVYGLALADSKQHVDSYTFIDHAVPNCHSNELYKNILDDDATGAFNGRVLVRENAQKTLAFQSNKNVCLTNTAKMYTKPQLEIYADDVKCSHGATVGQINEEALFYLRARGINEKEARMMLMHAFAYEVIEHIRVPVLAERYADLVASRLRGEFSKCEGCFIHCQ
jgi:Fe-S cluster assembly protein SufD